MARLLIVAMIAAVSGSAAVAGDVPPPKWDISAACASSGRTDPCPRVESDARRVLLDHWTALPAEMRTECAREVDVDGQRSYRKLAACIDDLKFKAFDEQRSSEGPAAPVSH